MAEAVELLSQLKAWHWLSLGIILIVIDSIATGGFLLGGAIAAFAVCLLKVVAPGLDWQTQLVLFSVLAIIFSVLYNRVFKDYNLETDMQNINNRAAQMVGRELHTSAALEEGQGKLQIGDTYWKVISPKALKKDTKVRISGYQEMTLLIEPMEKY